MITNHQSITVIRRGSEVGVLYVPHFSVDLIVIELSLYLSVKWLSVHVHVCVYVLVRPPTDGGVLCAPDFPVDSIYKRVAT